jgi:hypothetical protein
MGTVVVKLLVDAGADVHLLGDSETPLTVAIENHH